MSDHQSLFFYLSKFCVAANLAIETPKSQVSSWRFKRSREHMPAEPPGCFFFFCFRHFCRLTRSRNMMSWLALITSDRGKHMPSVFSCLTRLHASELWHSMRCIMHTMQTDTGSSSWRRVGEKAGLNGTAWPICGQRLDFTCGENGSGKFQ